MGIRGRKVSRWWSSTAAVAMAFLIAIPMVSGQVSGQVDGPATDRPTAPNPIPILSLSLFPSQLQAKVTQSKLGPVTFGGNATVEQMMFMDSTVTLQVAVNTGWPSMITPTTIVFKGSGTERFSVTVTVPPGTSSLTTGNVIVTGSCKAPGLSPIVASAAAVVTVDQYHKLRVESEDPQKRVSSGETAGFELYIYNDGNGPVTIRLSVLDTPKDIRVEMEHDEYSLQEEQLARVWIRVTPGARAPAGDHAIRVQVDAFDGGSDGGVSTVFNVTAVVPSMASEIGYTNIIVLAVAAGAAAVLAVLWKRGKLSHLKLPKRSKSED